MTEQDNIIVLQSTKRIRFNQRTQTIFTVAVALLVLIGVVIAGNLMGAKALETSFLSKEISPCLAHPFGTDWVGRDMFARTIKGLSLSIQIGLIASLLSTIMAGILGCASALLGDKVDYVVGILVDACMGVPHMLLLVMISYAIGGGTKGVIIAVAISHWPSLTRIVRSEILQLKESNYIKIAEQLGQTKVQIAVRHVIPHVSVQLFVGFVLMFPHAILHEASVTFLGFGMPADQPAIGRILQESMKYLVLGEWWLAVFPGIALLAIVLLFDQLGEGISRLIDPHNAHR